MTELTTNYTEVFARVFRFIREFTFKHGFKVSWEDYKQHGKGCQMIFFEHLSDVPKEKPKQIGMSYCSNNTILNHKYENEQFQTYMKIYMDEYHPEEEWVVCVVIQNPVAKVGFQIIRRDGSARDLPLERAKKCSKVGGSTFIVISEPCHKECEIFILVMVNVVRDAKIIFQSALKYYKKNGVGVVAVFIKSVDEIHNSPHLKLANLCKGEIQYGTQPLDNTLMNQYLNKYDPSCEFVLLVGVVSDNEVKTTFRIITENGKIRELAEKEIGKELKKNDPTSSQNDEPQIEEIKMKGKDVRLCKMCGKDGQKCCGQCGKARYCSVECQKVDWMEHKKICKK